MNDIEKRSQNAEYTIEAFQKLVLGFLPYGHVIDEFLSFRSNLKQKRIIDFANNLECALKEISGIDSNTYTTEEFVDVFDSVISKVQITKSSYKLERFKNILIKQIVLPNDDQLIIKQIQILDDLTDIQLIILNSMKSCDILSNVNFVLMLMQHDRTTQEELKNHILENKKNTTIDVKIGKDEIKLNKIDVDFYVNDLVSKGLLIKTLQQKEDHTDMMPKLKSTITGNPVNNTKVGITLFDAYKISETGKNFLKFIEVS